MASENLADRGVIHVYSRADAIADGTLVPVPGDLAADAGFCCPVALTRAVWQDCVAWAEADNDRKGTFQDETGRLWDVLWLASRGIAAARGRDRVTVTVRRVPRPGRGLRPRPVTLVAHSGSGDDGARVVTIMEPGED